jgi:hypothetical protein
MKRLAYIFLAVTPLLGDVCQSMEADDVQRAKEDIKRIKEDLKKFVSIRGQVTRPSIMAHKDTTVYAMIIAAGGPTKFGTLKRVKVTRDGKEIILDLTTEKGKNEEFIKPGDIVEVPQSGLLERNPPNKKG